jgi:hypothetical protein
MRTLSLSCFAICLQVVPEYKKRRRTGNGIKIRHENWIKKTVQGTINLMLVGAAFLLS